MDQKKQANIPTWNVIPLGLIPLSAIIYMGQKKQANIPTWNVIEEIEDTVGLPFQHLIVSQYGLVEGVFGLDDEQVKVFIVCEHSGPNTVEGTHDEDDYDEPFDTNDAYGTYIIENGMEGLAQSFVGIIQDGTFDAADPSFVGEQELIVEELLIDAEAFTCEGDLSTKLCELIYEFFTFEEATELIAYESILTARFWQRWHSWLDSKPTLSPEGGDE